MRLLAGEDYRSGGRQGLFSFLGFGFARLVWAEESCGYISSIYALTSRLFVCNLQLHE